METRILSWAFPWLMAILEFLLRQSMHDAGATAFIGPTVGGAALGMLLPFTRAREIQGTKRHAPGIISFDRDEDCWAQRANLAVWIGLTVWAVSLYLSLARRDDLFTQADNERISNLIGAILWLIAVLFDVLRGLKK
ncbi:hypothetical protein [Rugamonas aquatica]|uniref:Uncharacterized protein n=1 Tax=Rugamonas aquatica TaxID=2743357 RepID=A0A6A7N9F7_9BURK|nr:hypothetical protein [Rugamonas aquatica]MQA41664.1 hypothetical protein [Rugamonas aquatica]